MSWFLNFNCGKNNGAGAVFGGACGQGGAQERRQDNEQKGLVRQVEENTELALELENLLSASSKTRTKKIQGVDLKVFNAVWEDA